MPKLLQDILAQAASKDDHPKRRLVSLLPILEHRYSEEIGCELERSAIDSRLLIAFAVEEGSGYWRGLALRWLATGHPMDEAVANRLEAFGRSRLGAQHDRHEAFRLAVRWRKGASTEQDTSADADKPRR